MREYARIEDFMNTKPPKSCVPYCIFILAFMARLCLGQEDCMWASSSAMKQPRLWKQELQPLSSDSTRQKTVDFRKPVIYTATLMAVDLAFIIVTGIADKDPSIRNFREGFQKGPGPDEDYWFTNYILHPLMGSESYLRAREGGFSWFGSFLFSSAASIAWEFIYESWTERPSTQDLLVTSTFGSLLGEIRYQLKKSVHKKYYWFIDPIDTFFVSLKKTRNGKTQAVVGLTWDL
jgi:hypothetical protein